MNPNELITQIETRTNRHVDQRITDVGYSVWLGAYTDEHLRRESETLETPEQRDARKEQLRNEAAPIEEAAASKADTLAAALEDLAGRL